MRTWAGSERWDVTQQGTEKAILDSCLDGAGQRTGLLWEEEFGNGLQNGLDVNFGTELGNNPLLFPQ